MILVIKFTVVTVNNNFLIRVGFDRDDNDLINVEFQNWFKLWTGKHAMFYKLMIITSSLLDTVNGASDREFEAIPSYFCNTCRCG